MRLLKCNPASGSFELTSFNDDVTPPYAILSHTWTDGQEVTYDELLTGTGTEKEGYAKIRFCSNRAAADGLEYFWVDTCCINKTSSVELSTAINSMFRWYQRAAKCYVYLTDVLGPTDVTTPEASYMLWKEAFKCSRWFTRGWTLQELLAPTSVEFFSQDGKRLGSRKSLEKEIHDVTRISVRALKGQRLAEFSVEERMSWAAKRTTTIQEDKVYCLLGIFGVFLPLIYGEGEEYATVRLEEEIQKRQQGRGNVHVQGTTASLSLPFPRNELFVGRETQLQSIGKTLFSLDKHQRMTLHGIGGCGKSELALELAYRALAKRTRQFVFWVSALSRESFELAYREIGIRLRIPEISNDNADVKRLVEKTLSSGKLGSWLMIVDNADDLKTMLQVGDDAAPLTDFIPRSNEGSVLFITRQKETANDLTQRRVYQLEEMGKYEAKQLLSWRTTRQALLYNEVAVDELLETLTCLPLAIVQAAAYINQNNMSVSEYVSLLQNTGRKSKLFGKQSNDSGKYRAMPSTIAKTWYISFRQIRKQDALAAEYLSFMACVHRIGIPQSLLPPGGSVGQQTEAIKTLTEYGFITKRQQTVSRFEKEGLFDMPRFLHMALIWWLERHDLRATWADKVVARVKELVPNDRLEKREVWDAYLPHAMYVATLVDVVDGATRASLLEHVGRWQRRLGRYAQAETVYKVAFSLRIEEQGLKHTKTMDCMTHLSWTMECQDKNKEAEAMNRQMLARLEKELGPEHPSTLVCMQNVAHGLGNQKKYKEAEEMHRHTVKLMEKVLGPQDPDTLRGLRALSHVLIRQGRYNEVEVMERENVIRHKKAYGSEHIDTIRSLEHLQSALHHQDRYKEAEEICRQALVLSKKLLGPEHSLTLSILSGLSMIFYNQEKNKEAEEIFRPLLMMRKKLLGLEHPTTLLCMRRRASVLAELDRVDESLLLYQEAIAGYTKTLGKDHPDTVTCQRGYDRLCAKQKKRRSRAASSST
ncbi:kinesin light chain 1 [Pyrenophora seminiperda CCB06]|uniref:Kinesin light chain 1 n=1 Tax=Pyrenophora seminiperda CCB06 TaxID=1302712 RepID=A0A3M7M5I1_9PLEO|nr:kinesin light chain 1 [Pyrenophora seminiperda CCB06]